MRKKHYGSVLHAAAYAGVMLLCMTFLGLMGCEQDTASLTGKEIVSYEILSNPTNPESEWVKGVLSGDAHTIVVAGLPKGFNLSAVTPKISISQGASIYPSADQSVNFANGPMTYVVTAENGEKQEYVVSATCLPPELTERLASIRVQALPEKTVYDSSDSFVPFGLKVVALWNDGTTSEVEDYSLSFGETDDTGFKTVTVTYGGQRDTFKIAVKGLKRIEIQTPPTKTAYEINDTFNRSGLVVLAISTDNIVTKLEDSAYTLSITDEDGQPSDLTSEGKKTITVTYGLETALFNITVGEATQRGNEILSYALVEPDVQGALSKDAHTISIVVPTGTNLSNVTPTIEISEGATIYPSSGQPVNLANGPMTYVVTAEHGETQEYVVSAIYVQGLAEIRVQALPKKTVYTIGKDKALVPDGLEVLAIWTDNSVTPLLPSEYALSIPDLTIAGNLTVVTVTYGGQSATFNITVKDKEFTGITVAGLSMPVSHIDDTLVNEPVEPSAVVLELLEPIYHIGEAPDFTKLTERDLNGLIVTKYYDDDTSSVVPWGDYTITYDPNITGAQAIKVSVTDGVEQTTSFLGKVAQLKSLAVTDAPKKILYSITETFGTDPLDGLVLTGTFSDGEGKIIPSADVTRETEFPDPNAYKSYPITVTAGGKTASFEIGFYDPDVPISVAIAGDERIEIYNLTYGTAPATGFSFTLAWKDKKAHDPYATPKVPGTSYDDRLDKLIVSISSTYLTRLVGWYADGSTTALANDKNVLVIDAEDYTIGNHFLTLKLDSGKITETIKFNVIK